jgi:hypothetical protein
MVELDGEDGEKSACEDYREDDPRKLDPVRLASTLHREGGAGDGSHPSS